MELKKAFRLDPEAAETKNLFDLNNLMEAEALVFNNAKAQLMFAIIQRNSALKDLLLNKYEYLLKMNDKVFVSTQTHELKIFHEDDSIDQEIYE